MPVKDHLDSVKDSLAPSHTPVLDPALHKRRKQGQHHQAFTELFFLAVDATKPEASSPCHSDFPSEVDCTSTCLPKTNPSFLSHLGQVCCYSKETINEDRHMRALSLHHLYAQQYLLLS